MKKIYTYDIVSLGETMLRLAPPLKQRLEQCVNFDVTVGGSELSVVANLAGIGCKTAWVSKLPDNPMGRFVANKAREQGVDISYIVWSQDESDRLGLYFVEMGITPRPSRVYYDRKNSAASKFSADEIDWKRLLSKTKIFHVSGITPALSTICHDMTLNVMKIAKQQNCIISFDLNYRSKLWSRETAKQCYLEILPGIDILITNQFDCMKFFGIKGSEEEMMGKLANKFGLQTIAFTLCENAGVNYGQWSAKIWHKDEFITSEPQDVEILDRFGAGDAFVSGLLQGILNEDSAQGLELGNAMAILSQTTFGDISWIRKSDLDDFFQNKDFRIRR